MLERYLIPLAPFALAGLGCLVSLFVLLSVDGEMRRLKSRVRKDPDSRLPEQVAELTARLHEAEERASLHASATITAKSGLNISKRSQVIRMSRRGEPLEKIASALSLPRREVELLLKVHALAAGAPGGPTT